MTTDQGRLRKELRLLVDGVEPRVEGHTTLSAVRRRRRVTTLVAGTATAAMAVAAATLVPHVLPETQNPTASGSAPLTQGPPQETPQRTVLAGTCRTVSLEPPVSEFSILDPQTGEFVVTPYSVGSFSPNGSRVLVLDWEQALLRGDMDGRRGTRRADARTMAVVA